MDFKNLVAAELKLDIDYDKLAEELLPLKKSPKCLPFTHTDDYGNVGYVYSLFLRSNPTIESYNFRKVKSADLNKWNWDNDLDIPYTKSVVSNLPFNKLGAIRVIYFSEAPAPPHTDWDDSTDIENSLGLSIIPLTGNTFCKVWDESNQTHRIISGNAMLLNDAFKHEVPKSSGMRITMRIFGTIDYEWFVDKIVAESCYYSM